jgi:hypothetical protein
MMKNVFYDFFGFIPQDKNLESISFEISKHISIDKPSLIIQNQEIPGEHENIFFCFSPEYEYNCSEPCEFPEKGSYGGAFIVDKKGKLILKNCIIYDPEGKSRVDGGGAIYVGPDGELELENCWIINCKANKKGGGIYVYKKGTSQPPVSIKESHFIGCSAEKGGALACEGKGRITLNRNTFSGNSVKPHEGEGEDLYAKGADFNNSEYNTFNGSVMLYRKSVHLAFGGRLNRFSEINPPMMGRWDEKRFEFRDMCHICWIILKEIFSWDIPLLVLIIFVISLINKKYSLPSTPFFSSIGKPFPIGFIFFSSIYLRWWEEWLRDISKKIINPKFLKHTIFWRFIIACGMIAFIMIKTPQPWIIFLITFLMVILLWESP